MILVDTSVWLDHLREHDEQLASLLKIGQVCSHPFVIGEIALGSLHNRQMVIGYLKNLPRIPTTTFEETLFFIEESQLYSRGIGYVDSHLLAASKMSPGTQLWSRDQRLSKIASELNLHFTIQ